MLNYVSILYDEEEKLYKMWYTLMRWKGETSDGPRGVAYATSEDGLRWKKPILGLIEDNGSREKQPDHPLHAPVCLLHHH